MFLGGGGALWRVIVVQANNSFLSGLGSMESLFTAGEKQTVTFFGQGYWASCHAVLGRVSDFLVASHIYAAFVPLIFLLFLQVNSLFLEADLFKESFS